MGRQTFALHVAEHCWSVSIHSLDSRWNKKISVVCMSVEQISLPLAEIQNFEFGRSSLWVLSPRHMIVDLLWPLAQRGP